MSVITMQRFQMMFGKEPSLRNQIYKQYKLLQETDCITKGKSLYKQLVPERQVILSYWTYYPQQYK